MIFELESLFSCFYIYFDQNINARFFTEKLFMKDETIGFLIAYNILFNRLDRLIFHSHTYM